MWNHSIEATSYTAQMATFAANTTFEALPASFLLLLSIWMLDNFSVMLAGRAQPIYQSALEAVKITHGSGRGNVSYATLDGTQTSLSGQMYMMGFAAAAFEFEHVVSASHPASGVFPALLCVAAANHKSGKEFLSAMAIGYEYATRIGFATVGFSETSEVVEKETAFHAMINAPPATAAAVGNLMGWDAEMIASAMGLAASNSAGLSSWLHTEAETRRTHPASGGQLGAEAAFLAKAGIKGPLNVMEQEYGYLRAFALDADPTLLIDGLGEKWESSAQTLKTLPVHARSLGFVYAVDQYRQCRTWSPSDISNITVFAGPAVLDPDNWIQNVTTLAVAQYSIPFDIVAPLVVDMRNPLEFNDALVANPIAQDLTRNIKTVSISDDLQYFLGYMTFNIGDELVNITVTGYPGLPGDDGYQQAAEDKYATVLKALSLKDKDDKVKNAVMNLADCDDVSKVLDDLIQLGKAAKF
ncbi:2-methylcitrate dehydratase PrpD [Lophium mytilinum]|uniref:2-methylcitrate dehydratase PrpD n=1 Tax=Lophium mytilinum TaxID=390894 RepID=A0A6A6R321_9PEZI|nr:2-methylcitrate dehydratase PrpD [Lophium mytilinum]